jgi:hypothetical protein
MVLFVEPLVHTGILQMTHIRMDIDVLRNVLKPVAPTILVRTDVQEGTLFKVQFSLSNRAIDVGAKPLPFLLA